MLAMFGILPYLCGVDYQWRANGVFGDYFCDIKLIILYYIIYG
jgi:hypothetical protein